MIYKTKTWQSIFQGGIVLKKPCGNHVNAEYRSILRTVEVKEWQINTHWCSLQEVQLTGRAGSMEQEATSDNWR